MMKASLFVFLLIFCLTVCSGQTSYFFAEKKDSNREFMVKNGARVKIKTVKGRKHIGRLIIIDEQSVAIKGNIIKLNEIQKIKKKSVIGAVGGLFTIAYTGLIGTAGTAYSISERDTGLLVTSISFTALGAGLGIFINDTAPNHDINNWHYQIIFNQP